MSQARILVGGDEGIIGLEIKPRLETGGYTVPAVVGTGEDAIEKAAELCHDLLFARVNLAGEIDGIDAGRRIREGRDLPVVYGTAYQDVDTLDRASFLAPRLHHQAVSS